MYVHAPPPGHQAQNVQKLSGVQQVEYHIPPQPSAPQQPVIHPQPQKIVYVHAPPPSQPEGGIKTTASVAMVQHPTIQTAPYNPEIQQLIPQQTQQTVHPQHTIQPQQHIQVIAPPTTTTHQQVQMVQQAPNHGGLTKEQHEYVQPKPKEKIVYVEKPVEKIVYVDRKQKEEETLIEKKQQQTQQPPPEQSSGCCCVVL